jgi:Ca2+-dependent lipid-binding protein
MYKNSTYNSQKEIDEFNKNFIPANSKDKDTYSSKIEGKEKLTESLNKVSDKAVLLDKYISEKINMKFGMEVSVLVITTLLSIAGLVGKLLINIFFLTNILYIIYLL